MFTMLNRMCWNFRGWRLPTNTSGDGGYPSEMGFGVEEWNFQTEDAVDGYVYGYLYYHPSQKVKKESGGHFRIGFWSIHPETRQKLLVGIYNDATLLTEDDYIILDDAFTAREIYNRRAEELDAVVNSISFNDAHRLVTNSVRKHELNFKCPIEKVQHLSYYIPVGGIVKTKPLGQYFTRPTFIPEENLPIDLYRSFTIESTQNIQQRNAVLAEDAYYRESPQYLRRIIRRHNTLSNQFATWLEKSGYLNIIQEQNGVDIVFEKKHQFYRAELKICYGVGTTKAIREAIGQLLEYNHYPGRESADRWAIVLDEKATFDDIEYVKTLKEKHKLPISLGWRERNRFIFADSLDL